MGLDYRVYLIGADGHFDDVQPFAAADDNEAIEQLRKLRTVVPESCGNKAE